MKVAAHYPMRAVACKTVYQGLLHPFPSSELETTSRGVEMALQRLLEPDTEYDFAHGHCISRSGLHVTISS